MCSAWCVNQRKGQFRFSESQLQKISFLPQSSTEIGEDDLPMFEKFINMLNDCEDVQDIYHNAILPKLE